MSKYIKLLSVDPGPGSYRFPSEFGYYVSKHALK